MSSRIRSQRVGDLLRDELSQILSREMQDPRVGLVSVTAVEMSPDLRVAKVFLSPVDPAAEVDEVVKVLGRAGGYIRMQLTLFTRGSIFDLHTGDVSLAVKDQTQYICVKVELSAIRLGSSGKRQCQSQWIESTIRCKECDLHLRIDVRL